MTWIFWLLAAYSASIVWMRSRFSSTESVSDFSISPISADRSGTMKASGSPGLSSSSPRSERCTLCPFSSMAK